MSNRDYDIIKKVYDEYDKYDWKYLEQGDKYADVIILPEVAENRSDLYYAEIMPSLIIVTGYYFVRFYRDEDNYTFQQQSFVAIISNKNDKVSLIALITGENYANHVITNNMFSKESHTSKNDLDVVEKLYNLVNRLVNGVESLYDKFLGKDI